MISRMSHPVLMDHDHVPLYRVVREDCADPLDCSSSRRRLNDSRWNTPEFSALYCCCSEWVARAVTLDRLRLAGVELSDLQPGVRPQLVEVEWKGRVVDATSPDGVAAAGFDRDYPDGTRKEQTRRVATEWHATGAEGVVCRSAALQRRGSSHWSGAHQRWSEVAIFPDKAAVAPRVVRRRGDAAWLGG